MDLVKRPIKSSCADVRCVGSWRLVGDEYTGYLKEFRSSSWSRFIRKRPCVLNSADRDISGMCCYGQLRSFAYKLDEFSVFRSTCIYTSRLP